MCVISLVGNAKSASKHQEMQNKKFCKLSDDCAGKVTHDPQKVI